MQYGEGNLSELTRFKILAVNDSQQRLMAVNYRKGLYSVLPQIRSDFLSVVTRLIPLQYTLPVGERDCNVTNGDYLSHQIFGKSFTKEQECWQLGQFAFRAMEDAGSPVPGLN